MLRVMLRVMLDEVFSARYLVALLTVVVAYGVLVVHKVRVGALRTVRRVKLALENDQLDLAVSLLDDMELIFDV